MEGLRGNSLSNRENTQLTGGNVELQLRVKLAEKVEVCLLEYKQKI